MEDYEISYSWLPHLSYRFQGMINPLWNYLVAYVVAAAQMNSGYYTQDTRLSISQLVASLSWRLRTVCSHNQEAYSSFPELSITKYGYLVSKSRFWNSRCTQNTRSVLYFVFKTLQVYFETDTEKCYYRQRQFQNYPQPICDSSNIVCKAGRSRRVRSKTDLRWRDHVLDGSTEYQTSRCPEQARDSGSVFK